MAAPNDLLVKIPSDTRKTFEVLWESLPPQEQKALKMLIEGLPSEANLLRTLIQMARVQFQYTFGKKRVVAIVGPANVGKSTLYNQFTHSKLDFAEVSPVPGTTKKNQQADTGLFTVVDTPGADAIGPTGVQEQEQAMSAAGDADFLIILFDAVQGIKQTELDLYRQLSNLGKPYIVVLNKIDLVSKDQKRVLETAAINLNLKPGQMIPIVAKDGKNLSQILTAVAIEEPEIVAALGRALPQFRWQLAWKTIVSAASISAVIALTPLPVIDFAPLILTQSTMILGIARIYNYELNFQRARELIATFGLGLLGRTLFQELSKLGGLPGWLLSAAIAASTTVAMGYAAARWFENGEKITSEGLKTMSKGITQTLLNSLKGIRKPNQKSLQEKISSTLEDTDLGKDRSILDRQLQDNVEISE